MIKLIRRARAHPGLTRDSQPCSDSTLVMVYLAD